ncbi:MAG: hypothetical protein J07AB43_10230 [Candidatus Nanosalina sp. J07AB43]|nr:MAG: hypothetical protein J07AB43_10230 [Candidatus Nanosalina sp. J07AB43]
MIDQEFTVAVDPVSDVSGDFEAAIVLITCREGFDPEKLSKVCGRGTCVVLPEKMKDEMIPSNDKEFVSPGDVIDIYGVLIEAVKSGDTLSYRFNMKDSSFLVSPSPTDLENVRSLENTANVAFLSTSSDIDLDKVVRNAVKLKPEVVIPYRYHGERSLDGFKTELEDRNIEFRYANK